MLWRCRIEANQTRVLVAVNHWRSELHATDHERMWDRHETASELWGDLQGNNVDLGAIVMGDFNVEPNDPAFRFPRQLATRFADEAAANKDLTPLYNTAWRFLQDPLENGQRLRKEPWPDTRGSYYSPGYWHVFDQLLVSGRLLNKAEPLALLEDSVRYVAHDSMLTPRTKVPAGKARGMSDHFPLVASFAVKR